MKINEVITEGRSPDRYSGYNSDQLAVVRSNLDARELKLLKQYKEELLQKLEQRGISPDLVGKGVSTDPQDNLPLQSKLDIYREQVRAIMDRLKSDRKSFMQPGQQYQKEKQRMRKMSSPVTTISGRDYMAQQGK
jgi:hypothetical protein